jgi:hypothetical protein
MNSETTTDRLMATGLFESVRPGRSRDAPVVAFVNAAGHELLARLGRAEFQREVQQCESALARHLPGWTLGELDKSFWPADELRHPRAAPPVYSHLHDASSHRLLLDITKDLCWFDGHFPGNPILAGVVQLHLAVLVSRWLFGLNGYPQEISRLKFQRLVVPPRTVELELKETQPALIRFRYIGEGSEHSQGRLQFRKVET